MQRTQVQIPDALHEAAKELARRHEISLAEVVRRGLEHMLRLYPLAEKPDEPWRPPEPRDLGAFGATVEEWRELANESWVAEHDEG